MSFLQLMCFLMYNVTKGIKSMSKKSSKLMELSKMFDNININLDELSKDGIQDIISIVKRQDDTRYQPNVKHKIDVDLCQVLGHIFLHNLNH